MDASDDVDSGSHFPILPSQTGHTAQERVRHPGLFRLRGGHHEYPTTSTKIVSVEYTAPSVADDDGATTDVVSLERNHLRVEPSVGRGVQLVVETKARRMSPSSAQLHILHTVSYLAKHVLKVD